MLFPSHFLRRGPARQGRRIKIRVQTKSAGLYLHASSSIFFVMFPITKDLASLGKRPLKQAFCLSQLYCQAGRFTSPCTPPFFSFFFPLLRFVHSLMQPAQRAASFFTEKHSRPSRPPVQTALPSRLNGRPAPASAVYMPYRCRPPPGRFPVR